MIRPPRIRVAIDRLVLRGGNPADAAALRRALVTELSARLAEADAATLAERGAQAPARIDIGAGDGAHLGRASGRALAASLGAPGPGKRR